MTNALARLLIASLGLIAAACSPPGTDGPRQPTQLIYTPASTVTPPPRVKTEGKTWIASWGASPGSANAARDERFQRIKFRNVTIRQVVRLSAGGDAIRIRLTNEFGDGPLEIGAASVAIVSGPHAAQPSETRPVTFAGVTSATIPAGAPLLSDALDLPVSDGASLSISLYLPGNQSSCTCHLTGAAVSEVSPPGDFTASTFTPAKRTEQRAFLSGVDVLADDPARVIVAFGDSITDGWGSTINTNQRWPDLLADRLTARDGETSWAVVNAGISGNQLLDEGDGEAGLARFDRDVLSQPGLSHIIVFIGVNDIARNLRNGGNRLTPDQMIAGYRQLIARAHTHDAQILGATITPYEGTAGYWSETGEAVRLALNEWMRTSREFDAILDFDAVWADPTYPSRIAEALHSGDFIHGSDAGYHALADSIDLDLFR